MDTPAASTMLKTRRRRQQVQQIKGHSLRLRKFFHRHSGICACGWRMPGQPSRERVLHKHDTHLRQVKKAS